MKYSSKNKPMVCMQTNSTCYLCTREMNVKGILWHSTGCNNPEIRRYVQPSDNDPNRDALLKKIGKNNNGNDWNHIWIECGLNCWIGKLADGSVTTVQTMPWNFRPWGCGDCGGYSCNDGWIQFEICEDGLEDRGYFDKAYREACEITAYLCKMFNIDPKGTVDFHGVKVPTILCHHDSYKLGLGSGHGDIDHWFPKFGKSMETARNDVAKLIKEDEFMDKTQILNELGDAFVAEFKNLPTWAQKEMRVLLDDEALNGGTPKEVNPDDIGMLLSDVRVMMVMKRYIDKKFEELLAKLTQ